MEQLVQLPILHFIPINQHQKLKPQTLQFQVNLEQLNLMAKKNKDPSLMVVKKLVIQPTFIVVSYQKKPRNRLVAILKEKSEDDFIFVSFSQYNTNRYFARQCLQSTIKFNQEEYNFFGYSKSGLKNYSCYFYKSSKAAIPVLFNSLGHFDEVLQVSKKASKLSLLYSQSRFVCSVGNDQISIIEDVSRNEACFTDGCGYISISLARKIKRFVKQTEQQPIEYLPSVYQIRIKGIKGILLLNPQHQQDAIAVRPSMVKFKAKQDQLNELVLINYSRPVPFAAINKQIIMLLNGLGIESQYFHQLQQQYLNKLKEAMTNPAPHAALLLFLGRDQKLLQMVKEQEISLKRVRAIIAEQIYKNIRSKDHKELLRIPLSNARFLYGAVYPQACKGKSLLKQNQVFVRVTISPGDIRTIIGKVIVTKNPCYHCGDIRIMEAVDVSEDFQFANKLVDVIVFSTEGEAPICSTMAGSDYDGDQYFICWDQNLIPKKQVTPYSYPMTPPKSKQHGIVNQTDLINYFVDFDRSIVGKINNRFLRFAEASSQGVRCKQCVQLGTVYFSKAIDSINTGERVKLPQQLSVPIFDQQIVGEKVWIKMGKKYQQFFEQFFSFDQELIENWEITQQMMLEITQTFIGSRRFKDYQLFKMLQSWCQRHKIVNYKLFQYIDFSTFTAKQKRELQGCPYLPKTNIAKSPILNSSILSNYLLRQSGINFAKIDNLRPYYLQQGQNINFEMISKSLFQFKNVLIGIQVNQTVSIAFIISLGKSYPCVQNQLQDQSIQLIYTGYNELKYFKNKQLYKKYYRMYYNDQLLQIYQYKRSNSLLWLKGNNISIDLTRFDYNMLRKHPKINKEQIRGVQIFVQVQPQRKEIPISKLFVSPEQKIVDRQQPRSGRKNYKQKKYVQKK